MNLLREDIYLPCYDTPTFTFPLLATTTMLPFVTDTAVFDPLPTTVRPVPTVAKLRVPLPFVFKNCPAEPSEKPNSVIPIAPDAIYPLATVVFAILCYLVPLLICFIPCCFCFVCRFSYWR